MKNQILIVGIALFLVSCGTSKTVSNRKYSSHRSSNSNTHLSNLRNLKSNYSGTTEKNIRKILKDAEKYLGTPYKLGGNSHSGLDCSGLVCKVFEENSYKLPRRSADQSLVGDKVNINMVKPGDLLFFSTSGRGNISHVGIVHTVENDGEVKFIHASTSKGVIISSLNEKYWNKAYSHAQRIF